MLMSTKKKKQQKQMTPKPKGRGSNQRKQNGGNQASVAAAYGTPFIGKSASVKATRDTCNIKHRELISNIVGSPAFTVAGSFPCNPGMSATFPWLSVMAQGWEEYKFRKLRFCYKTRTGTNIPGSLLMAPDYDSSDPAPLTEQIASNYSQVVEDVIWKDITCELRSSNMNGALGKRHFIRSGALPANQDIKTYDVANLFVCTTDGTAVPWGKLWVEYDVDLFVPQLPAGGAVQLLGGKVVGAGGGLSAVNPLGNVPTIDPQALGFTVDGTSTITFTQIGVFALSAWINGTVLIAGPTFIAVGAVVTQLQSIFNTAATLSAFSGYVTVTAVGQTIQIQSVGATTVTACQVLLGLAPPNSMA